MNGDWGLGIGDWAQSPIPNPQSPIPNPQSPIFNLFHFYFYINKKENIKKIYIIKTTITKKQDNIIRKTTTYIRLLLLPLINGFCNFVLIYICLSL